MKLLTPRQVSDRFERRISVWRLWTWRETDQGPPFLRVGRRVFYPEPELEGWMRGRITRAKPPGN